MKIGYFISNIAISGGIKVVIQHVKILKEMGYDTILISRSIEQEWEIPEGVVISKSDKFENIPDCDVYVGTYFSDVEYLVKNVTGKVVHLCQGYEPIKYMARIKGEFLPEKYERGNLLSALKHYSEIIKYKRKIKKAESVYALPTVKAAVSRHLVEIIEEKYKHTCHLIQNGIDHRVFYPDEKRIWGGNGSVRILSIGSMPVGFKGIHDTLDAVKILKERGTHVELFRVSPKPPSRKELNEQIVDKFYTGLKEKDMANLYRNVDIYISSSVDVEGFGLPAMEALASGVPSILTEISSYKNFDKEKDFAYFVPIHRPDKIVEGVLTFIENKKLRENCIKEGFRVAKNYTLQTTKNHLFNFINKLV
jgi:glycosyltransferase involved in cell wall biosynthesis